MDNVGNIAARRISQAMQGVQSRLNEIESSTGLTFSAYMLRSQLLLSAGENTAVQDTSGVLENAGVTDTVVDLVEDYLAAEASNKSDFDSLPQSAYDSLFTEAAERYGVNPALIKAVCFAESSFRPEALSGAGAMGLMQLMPYTAEALGVEDPYDPGQSVDGGARLLSSLLDKFGGDALLAAAAYNCGAGRVADITDLSQESQRALLPSETQGYLERIEEYLSTAASSVLSNPYQT